MKQSSNSEYQKLKLIGKWLVSVLFISVIILLFYNNKLTQTETASAKMTSTPNPSIKMSYETTNRISPDLFVRSYAFSRDISVPNNQNVKRILLNSNKFSSNERQLSTSLTKATQKSNPKNIIPSIKKKKGKIETTLHMVQKTPITKGQKVVYLTFDDGPQAVSSQILTLLKKYRAKATFFMLDPNIKRYPGAVRQMVKEGHSIGSHGVTHDIHQIYRSPSSFVKEMKQTEKTIKKITGKESRLIRVPYGSVPYMKPDFRKASDQKGFIMWDWDIDSNDWQTSNGQFVENIKKQVENCSGKRPLIVLMHEKTSTVRYLEKVLQYFQHNGYQMKAITGDLKPVQFKYRPN